MAEGNESIGTKMLKGGEHHPSTFADEQEKLKLEILEAEKRKAKAEAELAEKQANERLSELKKERPSSTLVSSEKKGSEKNLKPDKSDKSVVTTLLTQNLGLSPDSAQKVSGIVKVMQSDKELGFFDKIKLMKDSLSVVKTDLIKKIAKIFPTAGKVMSGAMAWLAGSFVGQMLGLKQEEESFEDAYSQAQKNVSSVELPYNLRGDVYDQGLQIIADKESTNGENVWNARDHKNSSWGVFQFQGPVFKKFIEFLRDKGKGNLATNLHSFYTKNNYKSGKLIDKEAKKLSDQCRKEQLDFVKKTQLMQRVEEMKPYLPKALQEHRSPVTTLLIYNITHQCGWKLRKLILKEAREGYKDEKSYQKALIKASQNQANSNSDIRDRMKKILAIKAIPNPHPNIQKSVEAPSAKKHTVSYIDLSRNIKSQVESLGYPQHLFVSNAKNQNPQAVKKSINTVKVLYAQKDKFPIFYMDNENGTVQRVSKYLGSIGPKEKELQELLHKHVPNAGSLHAGKPSLRSMEKLFKKFPERKKELMEMYADIRIKNEESIGLNSISLVLDEGADVPRFTNEAEKKKYKKQGDVINVRGFKNAETRKEYAKILIEKSAKKGIKVLLKHFPGHKDIQNPHFSPIDTKKVLNNEMKAFLEILDWAKENEKANIVVMLGHIKLNIPDTEWDSEGKPIFASSKIMTKLHKEYPNIEFMTDDIGGMNAITDKEKARSDARENDVLVLN